jgi:hypothetical protein
MSTINNQTELGSMLGDSVSLRKVNNRLVVTTRRKRAPVTTSSKLEAAQDKFLEATQYAKEQNADDSARSVYATGITDRKRSAYMVAMADSLNAPEVHYIKSEKYRGRVGDIILVKTSDDFMVTNATIVITDRNGNELERGEASPNKRVFIWKYVATVANPSVAGTRIEVTVADRPGNEATMKLTL